MRRPESLTLGAPGLYYVPERPAPPPLGVPMDECAFVGVAPRGPAWELVEGDDGPERVQAVARPVRSWDDYRRLYGGFEGPGLLPLAVSAFFEQGGRVAHIVRVVAHARGADFEPLARAVLRFDAAGVTTTAGGVVGLHARNEGRWGEGLTAALSFSATTLPLPADALSGRRLTTGPAPLAPGTVLRITTADLAVRLAVVESAMHVLGDGGEGRQWTALLDAPVPGVLRTAELVEAALDVVDHDPERARIERFEHLGLMPAHPRWLGAVVQQQSELVEAAVPDGEGLRPTPALSPSTAAADEHTGEDRYAEIVPADVLERGVPAALAVDSAALLCVPDLYSPAPLPPLDDVEDPDTLAGAEFAECHPLVRRRHVSRAPAPTLPLLRLDPADADDLEQIAGRQEEVIRQAEGARVVALLDVPPGLRPAAVQRWRRRFASSYAAAYHPWARVPRDGAEGHAELVDVPPSAVAAGVVARIELARGLAWGPANEVARGVPQAAVRIPEREHGELHWAGVNVLALGPEGVVVTGARTLSTERMWRQLTVRRIVTMVERAVERRLQWAVFEPNTETTRTVIRGSVESLLMDLFRAGAFKGGTPDQCFFVRTPGHPGDAQADNGVLLCEIGLAPAEPMEFLLVRVSREGDATVRAESVHA